MSQSIWDTINPNTTSGTQLASLLDDFKNAVVSGLSGTTRPSELQASGAWIDTTNEGSPNFYWSYKVYDGANDIEVFRINLSTLKATIPGSDSFFEISKTTADTDGALLKFIKQRIANSGQVLDGDTVMNIEAVGRGDDASDPVVARIRVESLDNMGAAASGATIIFEATPAGSTSIVEIFRVIDSKMGIGTETPETDLDVQGTTGIQTKRVEDAVGAATITSTKQRSTGFGAAQLSDAIGKISHKTTDDAGAQNEVLSIESVATEAHTSTNQGTELQIKNTDIGAATPSTAMTIGSVIEDVKPSKINALEMAIQDIASAATIAALDTTKSIVRLTGSTATELQGVDATGNAKVVTINNGSTADMTLKHEDAGASATDRLDLPDGSDVVISPDNSITLFYSTTDTKWKVKSSSVGGGGSGSGTGKKNYLTGGNFESSINLATVYDDGAGIYVNGEGGSPTALTIDEEVTTPLAGVRSLKITKASISASGEGVTLLSEAIDLVDRGRNLYVEFEWDGTASNYTDGDVKIHGFSTGTDNTELFFVPIAGANDDGTLPALKTKVYGYFSTTTDTDATVRVSLHIESDSQTGLGYDLFVDDCSLSPSQLVPGAIITGWEDFTPTGTWTSGATYTGKYRRVGENAEVEIEITGTGTPSPSSLSVVNFLPSGLEVDFTKTAVAEAGQPLVGYTMIADATGSNYHISETRLLSSTTIRPTKSTVVASNVVASTITASNPIAFTTNDLIKIRVTVPIVGWTPGASFSTTEIGLMTAKARAVLSGTQTISSAAETQVEFDTKVYDNLNSFNTTNFEYVIPRTAVYNVNVQVLLNSVTPDSNVDLIIRDGGGALVLRSSTGNSVNTNVWASVSGEVELVKGTTLEVFVDADADASYTLGAGDYDTWFSISEVQDFSIFSIYGESRTFESSTTSAAYAGSVGAWYDQEEIPLEPGEYDMYIHGTYRSTGASSAGGVIIGISNVAGDVSPGLEGIDYVMTEKTNVSNVRDSLAMSKIGVKVTSDEIWYLKTFVEASVSDLSLGSVMFIRKVK